MLEIKDVEQLQQTILRNRIVFLDIYATWCGPCKHIAPVFEELANNNAGRALFAKTNCAEDQEIAHELGVSSVPTFVVFVNGEEVERIHGGNRENLREFVTRHAQ